MEPWNKEDRIFLELEVDSKSLVGMIAKASAQAEELQRTLTEIKRTLSAKELPTE